MKLAEALRANNFSTPLTPDSLFGPQFALACIGSAAVPPRRRGPASTAELVILPEQLHSGGARQTTIRRHASVVAQRIAEL